MAFRIAQQVEAAALRSVAETHPRLRGLRQILMERHGLSEARAGRFVEWLLMTAVDDFGESYLGEMSARINKVVRLRDRISSIYEATIEGRALPKDVAPGSVEAMFSELQGELEGLKSPTRVAQEQGPRVRDDVVSRALTGLEQESPRPARAPEFLGMKLGAETRGVQSAAFKALDGPTQRAVRKGVGRAPDLARKLIMAETSTGRETAGKELAAILRGEGTSEAEIGRMIRGLEEMNRAQREAARSSATLLGRMEMQVRAEAAKAGAGLPDPALSNAVQDVRYLERLAREAPNMLAELWDQYRASGSKGTFRQYVLQRMSTHIRGMTGEFTAAFDLGEGLSLLKGPDYDVTIPGTDLVGVVRDTGETWLIDNKALRGDELSTVNALTRNLPPNLSEDVVDFRLRLAGKSGVPPHIRQAVQNLGRANRAIQRLVKGLSPEEVNSFKMQREIARILEEHRIRRVVTNAGGEIRGLSSALTKKGIELEDLNR